MKCTQCGANLQADSNQTHSTCQYCGTPFNIEPIKNEPTKFCKFCGKTIHFDAVICTQCGRQVETVAQPNLPVNINIANPTPQPGAVKNIWNDNNNNGGGRRKEKWVTFFLCLLFGLCGVHRFYEGKIVTGLLWLFTGGLFVVGWFVDMIIILCKPNPYYV